MLPRFIRQLVEKAGDETVIITSSATVTSYDLKPYERIVRAYTDGSNALVINLPPAALCPGVIFDICHVTKDTVDVTVAFQGSTITNGTLDTSGDYAVVQSNGFEYRLLVGNGS